MMERRDDRKRETSELREKNNMRIRTRSVVQSVAATNNYFIIIESANCLVYEM